MTFQGRPLRELHHSRLSGIWFVKIAPDDWRHVFVGDNNPATVGPIYKSRGELLADSNRYCRENWDVSTPSRDVSFDSDDRAD